MTGYQYQFQSTPPRGWRRPCNPVTSRYIVISIHSTARVETISMTAIDNVVVISIHSTARVETIRPEQEACRQKYFNPLHREGGDAVPVFGLSQEHSISIHSTARVETFSSSYTRLGTVHFNPLHREGGDQRMGKCKRMPDYFNPLHREGGDLGSPGLFPSSKLFQSTPPRGWRLHKIRGVGNKK